MSKIIKIKVDDLSGAILDWAVAQEDGVKVSIETSSSLTQILTLETKEAYAPSMDWNCGGPLIEKFSVELTPPWLAPLDVGEWVGCVAIADGEGSAEMLGKTPLVAACRAVVAARVVGELGQGLYVSVPAELLAGYTWRPALSRLKGPLPWDGVLYDTEEAAYSAARSVVASMEADGTADDYDEGTAILVCAETVRLAN